MDRLFTLGSMRVLVIGPCGDEDNYAYLIYDESTKDAAVVDPAVCAQECAELISSQGLKLKQIWTTHHHYDHAFTNAKMSQFYPGLEVVGRAHPRLSLENIPGALPLDVLDLLLSGL